MQGITMEQAQEASEEMRYEAYRECLKRCGEKRPFLRTSGMNDNVISLIRVKPTEDCVS